MSSIMTYGEAHIFVLLSDLVVIGNRTMSIQIPEHKPRMNRKEALSYYGNKIATEFHRLGYVKKAMTEYAPEPLKMQQNISDFDIKFPIVLRAVRHETNKMIRHEARKNIKLLKELVA